MALARRVPQFRIRGQMYTHEGAYAYLRSPISALTDVRVPSSGLRPQIPTNRGGIAYFTTGAILSLAS